MNKFCIIICAVLFVSCVPLKERNGEPQTCLAMATYLIASTGVTLSCASPTAKDIDSTSFSPHVKIAMKAYINYKLSSLAFNCITFEEDTKIVKGKKSIEIREIHNKSCGGDLRTAPRVLSLAIDVKTLKVQTDSYSIDGVYQNLRKPLNKKRHGMSL